MTAMLSTMKKLLSGSTTQTNPLLGNSSTTSPNVSGSVNNGGGSGSGGLGNKGNADPDKPQHSDAGLSAKDKEVLASWVISEFGKMKSARQTIQRKWYMNLAMYYGRQYLDVLPSAMGGTLGVPKAPRHRARATVNLVRPMVRTEISRMTSQKPSATFVPASSEDEDLMAAQAAEQLWESVQARNSYNAKMIKCAFWTAITGNGFVKTRWDNNVLDQYNLNAYTKEPSQGAVCHEVVTPFHLFIPDQLIEEIEDQPYVFEAYTRSVPWIKKYLGDKVKDVNITPDAVSKDSLFEAKYMEVQGGQEAKPDSVLFIEAWVKPGAHDLLPDGGLLTVVNTTIIAATNGMPYSHGEYPYAHQKHIPTGTFYGDSVLNDIVPLQKEYNRTRSHIVESKNRMARPQLLVPMGSMDASKYTSEPGLLIPYNPVYGPPTPLPMQALPEYVLQEQDRIKADMEDISGQHQATKGMSPGGGVEAATAIAYLQEKDDSLLATTYASIEALCEKNARQTICLVVDYWDIPRMVRTIGSDSSFDVIELKGSQISNAVDVRVEGGSALPQSKPARQAFLMDLAKMQFISPEQLLDMLDIGGIQKLQERIRVDMNAATRENMKMKRLDDMQFQKFSQTMQEYLANGSGGQQDPQTGQYMFSQDPTTWPPIIPVNEWDNHQVHIATHNNYRKGQEFETLPQGIKDQFETHIKLHTAALQAQSQGGMMAGSPTPPPGSQPGGSPGGPPTGESPGQEPSGGPMGGGGPASQASPGAPGTPPGMPPGPNPSSPGPQQLPQ